MRPAVMDQYNRKCASRFIATVAQSSNVFELGMLQEVYLRNVKLFLKWKSLSGSGQVCTALRDLCSNAHMGLDMSWQIFIVGVLAVLIALISVAGQAIRPAIVNPLKSLRVE
jgi:hypothetical protein